MVTQVSSGRLTSLEQLLVDHVIRGEWLDLAADEVIDEATMRSWGSSRTCRASVIRAILCGQLAPDPDPHGLRLRGARISGRLDLENLTTKVSFELTDCLLEEGLLARHANLAFVGLPGCLLEHRTEMPLHADWLSCTVLLLAGAKITGHSSEGTVRLAGARLSGDLDCAGANLVNDSGPVLVADGLRVDGDLYLRRGFSAVGAGPQGAVSLLGAHIGGMFDCTHARMENKSGLALQADGLQVDQSMFLRGRFYGAGSEGAVRLIAAHIGGQLSSTRGDLRNESGPALVAEGLQVGQNLFLHGQISGVGPDGAARLLGAHIGGALSCTRTYLSNEDGPALAAESLQVDLFMNLAGGHFTSSSKDHATIELTGARVAGTLTFNPAVLENKDESHHRLAVEGLTYAGVPREISAQDLLKLLQEGTPGYTAQPYQQLAAGYRALGEDREVRKILIAQRDAQLGRTQPHWSEKLWGRITKVTLGYGYKPWRALWFLAAVLAVSCVLAVVLGSHGALTTTDKTAHEGKPCTVVQKVSVGLDLNLPVGTTSVARAKCDLTKDSASATAAWLSAMGWVLRVLAWVFAALFIAGFTSAVRKT